MLPEAGSGFTGFQRTAPEGHTMRHQVLGVLAGRLG